MSQVGPGPGRPASTPGTERALKSLMMKHSLIPRAGAGTVA